MHTAVAGPARSDARPRLPIGSARQRWHPQRASTSCRAPVTPAVCQHAMPHQRKASSFSDGRRRGRTRDAQAIMARWRPRPKQSMAVNKRYHFCASGVSRRRASGSAQRRWWEEGVPVWVTRKIKLHDERDGTTLPPPSWSRHRAKHPAHTTVWPSLPIHSAAPRPA